MWLSDRTPLIPRCLAVTALAALASCGFQPVYAPGGAGLALRDAVIITAPDTPFDYRLRTTIEDRLGVADTARFTLTLTTAMAEVAAAIAPDGSITRYNLTGTATWALNDAGTAAELAAGQVDSFTSYGATGTTIATRSAEGDARDRLATALADLIVAQLLIASADLPQP